MGGRLARSVMRGGHEMTICDLSMTVQESFAKDGAGIAAKAADCATAEVVIICVLNGKDVLDVVSAPDGLASGIDPARPPIVLIMSTILPADVRKAADFLAAKGARVVDAAVTGGLKAAEEGTLTLMTGGEESDIAAVEPLLKLMGKTILRCGPLGSGETAKIINNAVGTTNMYLAFESYRLGQANGLTPDDVGRLLIQGTGNTFWHQNPAVAVWHYDVLTQDPRYFSQILHATAKDWKLSLSLAADAGLRLPFIETLTKLIVDLDDGTLLKEWREFTESQGKASEAGRIGWAG